jgi:hypothetical protein
MGSVEGTERITSSLGLKWCPGDDTEERNMTVTFIWGSDAENLESPFVQRNTSIYVQAVSFEGNAV